MKYIYIIVILLLSTNILSAQDYNATLPQISPISPNASALARYADYPVSHYTGVPDISIPIYEIDFDDFKLPISLNYHASGIKINQESSWVGLGWTLNAGGNISRTIKCFDDFLESPQSYQSSGYYEGPEANDPSLKDYYLDPNYPNKSLKVDSEPDIFYYTLPEGTGKFLLDKSRGAVLFENTPRVKIDVIASAGRKYNFIITTPNGTRYEYKDYEMTEVYSEAGVLNYNSNNATIFDYDVSRFQSSPSRYTSSWYLSKITTPNKREIIFQYTKENYHSPTQESGKKYTMLSYSGANIPDGIDNGNITITKSKSVQDNLFLSKIIWDNGYVEFVPSEREDIKGKGVLPKKLEKLNIFNNDGSLIKGIVFSYDYFNNNYKGEYQHVFKRLKLNGISEVINPNIKYEFNYFEGVLPAKNSKNTDYWGFHNGKKYDREYYCSAYDGNKVYSGAVKTSDLNYLKIGTLNSIKYPTGGSSIITYEENTYNARDFMTNISANSIEYTLMTFGTSENNPSPAYDDLPRIDSYTFTIKQTTSVTISGFLQNLKRSNPYHTDNPNWKYEDNDYPLALLKKTDSTAKTISIYTTPNLNSSNNAIFNYMDRKIDLAPGTYVFEATSPIDDVYAEFTIAYQIIHQPDSSQEEIIAKGGGLRVSKIEVDNKIRHFEYPIGTLLLNPIISTKARISSERTSIQVNGDKSVFTGQSEYFIQLSESTIALNSFRNGNAIGYDWVKEYITANGKTAATQYVFYNNPENPASNPGDSGDEYAYLPPDINYSNGLPKKITDYSNEKEVKITKYDYEVLFNERPIYAFIYNNAQVVYYNESNESGTSIKDKAIIIDEFPYTYTYDVEWRNKKTETVTLNSSDGSDQRIIVEDDFSYNNYSQLAVNKSYKYGKWYEQKIYYPTDFNDNISKGMVSKHMIKTPIEKISLKNEKVIAAQKIKYTDTLGMYLPQIIYSLNTNTPLSQTEYKNYYYAKSYFDVYNSWGKPLQIRDKNNLPIVYLWGYSGQYPIAKIENATYNDVKTALGATPESLSSATTPDFSKLAVLRTHTKLAGALITTYKYKPLVGMTEMTDPREVTTHYEYDSFGRLKATYIQEKGSSVKKLLQSYDYHYQNQ